MVLVREVTLTMLATLIYSVVAITALFLCQAHMSILLSKAIRLQSKTVLTS